MVHVLLIIGDKSNVAKAGVLRYYLTSAYSFLVISRQAMPKMGISVRESSAGIIRSTVTSTSRTGGLGTAWFDYGVAISPARYPLCAFYESLGITQCFWLPRYCCAVACKNRLPEVF